MAEKEWRVVCVEARGRFRIHGSEASARSHMDQGYQFDAGENGAMKLQGKLQSRNASISGDDSTWTDEPHTRDDAHAQP